MPAPPARTEFAGLTDERAAAPATTRRTRPSRSSSPSACRTVILLTPSELGELALRRQAHAGPKPPVGDRGRQLLGDRGVQRSRAAHEGEVEGRVHPARLRRPIPNV